MKKPRPTWITPFCGPHVRLHNPEVPGGGELVNAGTPVLEITDIEHTYVKVFISETKIGRVHLDQEAEVSVASFPDRVFKGRVVWINDAGDFAVRKAVSEQDEHDLRSFEVKIDLPTPTCSKNRDDRQE